MKRIKLIELQVNVKRSIKATKNIITSVEDVIDILLKLNICSDSTQVYLISLDERSKLINISMICKGIGFNRNIIRDIIKNALISNAKNVVIYEYKPIDNIIHDAEYFKNINLIKIALETVGLNLLDYIIQGYDKTFCSLAIKNKIYKEERFNEDEKNN